eukprot:7128009-Pyramimonas_sp.AAC.3
MKAEEPQWLDVRLLAISIRHEAQLSSDTAVRGFVGISSNRARLQSRYFLQEFHNDHKLLLLSV